MDQFTKHLAVNVLNESRVVNYRQLSRSLKVHSHLAKQMLYDFHKKQNAKKSQSVHATYLLTGSARSEPTDSTNGTQSQSQTLDDDSIMQSSPFPSSFPEPSPLEYEDEDAEPTEESVSTTLVMLVKEEDLEAAKEEFEEIDSTFVYSLQPGSLLDMQVIAHSHREMVGNFTKEDPLKVYQQYGIIQNPNVRRRKGGLKPPPPSAPVVAKAAVEPAALKSTTKDPTPLGATSRQNSNTSVQKVTTQTINDSKAKPTLQREKSDIFSSFAKTKAPKPKEAAPTAVEDSPMANMSEDEDEDDDIVMIEAEEKAKNDEKAAVAKAEREERQKKLREMMDDDENDEDMADVPPVEEAVDEGSPIDKPAVEEPNETVEVVGGRRRGRRRIMKKKTMKDEEGYLVTKEEAGWESFSEDEPQPKKMKTLPPTTAKGKKAAGKPGQGNIMSFFSKK